MACFIPHATIDAEIFGISFSYRIRLSDRHIDDGERGRPSFPTSLTMIIARLDELFTNIIGHTFTRTSRRIRITAGLVRIRATMTMPH